MLSRLSLLIILFRLKMWWDGNFMSPGGKQLPPVPNFNLGAFQSQQNISAPSVFSVQSPLPAGRTFVSESGIRPRTSASLPGETFGVYMPVLPISGRRKTTVSTNLSSDFDSRSQAR